MIVALSADPAAAANAGEKLPMRVTIGGPGSGKTSMMIKAWLGSIMKESINAGGQSNGFEYAGVKDWPILIAFSKVSEQQIINALQKELVGNLEEQAKTIGDPASAEARVLQQQIIANRKSIS